MAVEPRLDAETRPKFCFSMACLLVIFRQPTISSMNFEIDQVFNQIQMRCSIENLPEGFHIFRHSSNQIFATNVRGILKILLRKFSKEFLHEDYK